MPAYWVARAKVNDPVEYRKYADRVPAILAKYGAKVLARGGRYQTLEGPEKFNRFVVIVFPTFEQGVACFNSQEYKEAAAFRRNNKAGENELVMIEAGGGAPKEAALTRSLRSHPHPLPAFAPPPACGRGLRGGLHLWDNSAATPKSWGTLFRR